MTLRYFTLVTSRHVARIALIATLNVYDISTLYSPLVRFMVKTAMPLKKQSRTRQDNSTKTVGQMRVPMKEKSTTKRMLRREQGKVNITINELRHEIYNNVVCATSKASDQPVRTCSLIRAFASRMNIL